MDDPKADVNTGEGETPVASPPEAEQQTTPEIQSEDSETAEKPEQTPETLPEKEGVLPDQLPEDKTEQGRAFAEMRRKIKALEDQVAEKKTRQSSFDSLSKIGITAPPPQFVQVDQNRFYDQQGNFNKPAYDIAVQQAGQHNQQVQRQIANETVEYKLDEYKARQKFPELNTNRKFERAVAAEYQTRLLETISDPGKPQPLIEEIADEYAPYFASKKDIVREATQKVKEQLSVKEQASLAATGKSQPGQSGSEDYQKLRMLSRKGDSKAIMERFKRIRSR